MEENKGQLKIEMPSQGWKQFLTARKEMLDTYDKAKTHSKAHKVETYHGKVAEAEFRKWLINFLPKKYGVTSGYIISQGVSDLTKAPHFDVIIYDHLESPILWVENNPDSSNQGKSLAIPAEYVKAVLEIKSAFKNSTVKDAFNHLNELSPLMSSVDSTNERYKMYFPKDFFCGTVFFELRKEDENDKEALFSMLNCINLRNFFGGLILRGDGKIKEACGKINILSSETEIKSSIKPPERTLLTGFAQSDSIKINDSLFFSSMLMFTEPAFAQFAFDIIALMSGKYEPGRLSSFYAFGTSEWESEWKSTKKRKKKTTPNISPHRRILV